MALLQLAEVGVGDSQVAQVIAFAAPVADFLGNGQRLLVKVDGLVYLAEVSVGAAQVAQVRAFIALISSFPSRVYAGLQGGNSFRRVPLSIQIILYSLNQFIDRFPGLVLLTNPDHLHDMGPFTI